MVSDAIETATAVVLTMVVARGLSRSGTARASTVERTGWKPGRAPARALAASGPAVQSPGRARGRT